MYVSRHSTPLSLHKIGICHEINMTAMLQILHSHFAKWAYNQTFCICAKTQIQYPLHIILPFMCQQQLCPPNATDMPHMQISSSCADMTQLC